MGIGPKKLDGSRQTMFTVGGKHVETHVCSFVYAMMPLENGGEAAGFIVLPV